MLGWLPRIDETVACFSTLPSIPLCYNWNVAGSDVQHQERMITHPQLLFLFCS
jgi:hypothetical protein